LQKPDNKTKSRSPFKSKRVLKLLVSCFLLSLFFVVVVVYVKSTQKTIPVSPSDFARATHTADKDCYSQFETYYLKAYNIRFAYATDAYSRQEACLVFNKIHEDLTKIYESVGAKTISDEVEIYVLNSMDDLGGTPYVSHNKVFCTKQDIEIGSYRLFLVQAALPIKDLWQAYGVEGYAFSELVNNEAIKAYLKSNTDPKFMRLYGDRFLDKWNSASEIQIAKQISISLTSYLLKKGTLNNYLNPTNITAGKNSYLKSLSKGLTYDGKYENDLPSNMYITNNIFNNITITSPDGFFYKFNQNPDPNFSMSTSSDIEEFMLRAKDSRDYILNYIKKNDPQKIKWVEDNLKRFKGYVVMDPHMTNLSGEADVSSGKAYIYSQSSQVHEMVHFMTTGTVVLWQSEAVADYFSLIVYKNDLRRVIYYDMFTNDKSRNSAFWNDVITQYIKNGGSTKTPQSMNFKLYIDIASAISYSGKYSANELPRVSFTPYSSVPSSAGQNFSLGGEFSYWQGCSFLSYLVENFGLDKVMDYCQECENPQNNFKKVFGVPYNTLKDQWQKHLQTLLR
jgi:hypothetical protein